MLANVVPSLFVLGVLIVSYVPQFLAGEQDDIFLFIMAAIFLGTTAVATWNTVNQFIDLTTSMPEMIDGTASKVTRQKGSGRSKRTVYYYVVGGKEFEVSAIAYKAIIEGLQYRVFYTPRTTRLLSIESLGGIDDQFSLPR